MLETKTIEYFDQDILLEGVCVYDAASKQSRPAILIAHDWTGRTDFNIEKAHQLAEMGYISFALDMYGRGKIAKNNDEKLALMKPLIEDRKGLLRRIMAAFDTVKSLPQVNPSDIGAIGFCFGGLCALDLARSGSDVKAVVSFHGALTKPQMQMQPIKSKILVLHGYEDPRVPPEELIAFVDEMRVAKTDWEVVMYGNAKHAFTNPKANDERLGTVYNEQAARRSWKAMETFLDEVLPLKNGKRI